jgi:hypothetical protein
MAAQPVWNLVWTPALARWRKAHGLPAWPAEEE